MTEDVTFKSSSLLAVPIEDYSLNNSSRSTSPDIPIHTPPSESSDEHPPKRRPIPLSLRPAGHPVSANPFPASGDIRFTGSRDGKVDEEVVFDLENEHDPSYQIPEDMSRPSLHRPTDGRSATPLLVKEEERETGDPESMESSSGNTGSAFVSRRSTFRSRSPEYVAKSATKKKYLYATFFLLLSLVSFVVQTESAKYVMETLGWKKSYCML